MIGQMTPNATTPHYGAGVSICQLLPEPVRGEDATKAVVASELNGMESIDQVLRDFDATDPLTDQPIDADDFFADWAITNLLHDDNVADGRYFYNNYDDAPQASTTETVTDCDTDWNSRTVSQYGADYIEISMR